MKDTKLLIKVEKENVNGRVRYQTYSFNKINELVSDDQLYKAGQSIAALQQKALRGVFRQDVAEIKSE